MMITQKSIEKVKLSYNRFFTIQFCTSMIFIFFMAFSSQRMYGMTNTYRYVSRPPIRGSFYKGSELSAHSLKFFLDNVVIQKTELLDTDESKKKMKKLLILRDFVSLLADGLAGCREQQFSFVKLIFSLNDLWKDYRTEIDLIQKPTICWYGLLHLCDYQYRFPFHLD